MYFGIGIPESGVRNPLSWTEMPALGALRERRKENSLIAIAGALSRPLSHYSQRRQEERGRGGEQGKAPENSPLAATISATGWHERRSVL